MSDLIKRSDAIKALYKYSFVSKGIIEKEIRAIPTADRPQEWIPCSERMPNKQSDYLVTISLYDNSTYVDVLHFHKGKFYEIDSEWGDVEYDDVTAWMPLPKPWKGADDE